MIVLLRYTDSAGQDSCRPLLEDALAVLGACDGFESGWIGRSPDDPERWVLGITWRDVGALRHGLGSFDAKVALGALQAFSSGDDSVLEVLVAQDATGSRTGVSDRAGDADRAGPGPRYP